MPVRYNDNVIVVLESSCRKTHPRQGTPPVRVLHPPRRTPVRVLRPSPARARAILEHAFVPLAVWPCRVGAHTRSRRWRLLAARCVWVAVLATAVRWRRKMIRVTSIIGFYHCVCPVEAASCGVGCLSGVRRWRRSRTGPHTVPPRLLLSPFP